MSTKEKNDDLRTLGKLKQLRKDQDTTGLFQSMYFGLSKPSAADLKLMQENNAGLRAI